MSGAYRPPAKTAFGGRVAQREADLLAVAAEVQRHVDRIEPGGSEVRLEVDGRVHVHDGDTVAGPDACAASALASRFARSASPA